MASDSSRLTGVALIRVGTDKTVTSWVDGGSLEPVYSAEVLRDSRLFAPSEAKMDYLKRRLKSNFVLSCGWLCQRAVQGRRMLKAT